MSESVGARVNSDNTTALIVALNSGIEDIPASPMPLQSKQTHTDQISQPPKPDPFANFAESNF